MNTYSDKIESSSNSSATGELPFGVGTANNRVSKIARDFESGLLSQSYENEKPKKGIDRSAVLTAHETEKWPSLVDEVADMIAHEQRELYNESQNALDLADFSYNEIDLIPLVVGAQTDRIWNFCVGYSAIAMARKGTATDTIQLLNGTSIGLYYFAAQTLFYSFEECSVGRIPPLQRVQKELLELFYAGAPVNKSGKAYTVNWDGDLRQTINNLPYHSFANPAITVAPHLGTETTQGLNSFDTSSPPTVSLNDLREVGPDAFEKVQRYFLGARFDSAELSAYTTDGPCQNTSMFAFPRDPGETQPVNGFSQVVNEVSIPHKDYWLMSLGFYTNIKGRVRDGWHAKTVQIGTHAALYRMLVGAKKAKEIKRYQTHQINISLQTSSLLQSLVAASVNSNPDNTIQDILSSAIYSDGYVDQLTAGQLLIFAITILSRAFFLGGGLCAGTAMPYAQFIVGGVGSMFLTRGDADTNVAPMQWIEERASLSAYQSHDGTLHIPVLGFVNSCQTVAYDDPGQNSLLLILTSMFPEFEGLVTTFDLKTPSPTQVGDIIDFDTALGQCYCSGSSVERGNRIVSSIISSLQGSMSVGEATGNRDGPTDAHLFLTHYLDEESVKDCKDGKFDLSPLYTIIRTLSTRPVDPRHMSNVMVRPFPVMYGTTNTIPAYQALFVRIHSVEIDEPYLDYRAPIVLEGAHKLAANLMAPSEFGGMIFHRIIVGDGGNFIDSIFKDGKWVNAAQALAGGIAKFIHPDLEKVVKNVVGKGAKAIHKHVFEGKLHPIHLAPISSGGMALGSWCEAHDKMLALNALKKPPVKMGKKKKATRGKRR